MSEEYSADDLVDWRKGHSWSQVDAAAALRTSRRTYQRWESGETPLPGIVMLACLGVSYSLSLLTGKK